MTNPKDISWEAASEAVLHYALEEDHLDEVAELLAKLVRPYLAPTVYKKYFQVWEEKGFHVTPNHFYQPIPDTRTLSEDLWIKEPSLIGIDLNEASQLHLLQEVFPQFQAEYNRFSSVPTSNPHEYHFNKGLFGGTDALVLYCMVRHFQPSSIIEVGSGVSSLISAQAALKNGNTRLTCIEPYPDQALQSGFPGLTTLIPKKVEEVDIYLFEELGANDILFIDSSHVVKIGGDVNYLFFEILPRLKPGVVVHIHDIFLPSEYRRDWVMEEFRFWNEQYLLHAFLLFNTTFEVLIANGYLGKKYTKEMQAAFPNSPWWGGGSFWMRRKEES